MAKIIFITGTDTGVGKTVLTSMLLHYLQQNGCDARAMKPFCSGSRADARLLGRFQKDLLTLEEINPFFFDEPVAPLAAAGKRKNVRLDTVLGKIRAVARRCDVLLVEGIGGLLVPCGEKVTVLDIIKKLRCPVLVVSRNRLGTINHTLLTINVLETSGIENFAIVMMGVKKPDISARNNVKIIQKMAPGGPVFEVPRLKFRGSKVGGIKINVTFLKKTLARILGDDSFNAVLPIKRRKG